MDIIENTILFVEDDPEDVELALKILEDLPGRPNVVVRSNGVEAMEYLNASCDGTCRQPALILADLRMPRMNGLELIEKLRRNPKLASIPVVIFSSSASDGQVEQALRLGVKLCLRKPSKHSDYPMLLSQLNAFF